MDQESPAASPDELLPDESKPGSQFIVGIGASAGGLASVQEFFRRMPTDSGLAFVLVQHLSPTHKSLMAEILGKYTDIPIVTAVDDMPVEPNRIALIPPTANLRIEDGRLRLVPRDRIQHLNFPIDLFFTSLAEEVGMRAIGVILSGTGTDGTQGIRSIKHAGGIVIVQDDSAQFDGMPRSAIGTGLADVILPPEKMAERLVEYSRGLSNGVQPEDVASGTRDEIMGRILGKLHERTGTDFRQYRMKTVQRRIEKRMRINQVSKLEDYCTILEASAEETKMLFRELTIGVTSFFRDPDSFEILEKEVLPPIVERAALDSTIRVWVAGCSTGEEAFSLAILLFEAIEKADRPVHFKVFATDIDQSALHTAGSGLFPRSIEAHISEERLARHFQREGDYYRVARRIRQRIVFAAHNVAKDPPFTRVDIVSCRNLLIYQQPALQERVLSYLRFALVNSGVLFLGASEGLGIHDGAFEVLDARWRLFRRREIAETPPLEPATSQLPARMVKAASTRNVSERRLFASISTALLRERGTAAVVVDDKNTVLHVFGETREYLRIPEGEPTLRLDRLLQSDLHLAALDLVRRMRQDPVESLRSRVVTRGEQDGGGTSDTGPQEVDLALRQISQGAGRPSLYVLVFGPRTELASNEDPLTVVSDAHAEERLRALELELGETKEHLQSTIEELESANEELQSTNEELIASNEELQSTNEELHSVNEELHTVNAEHQRKLHEQELLAADLDHLLKTTDIGSIFLDVRFSVRKYTPAVSDVIPLMPQDVGRPIAHIRHDLVDVDLVEIAEAVFGSGETFESRVRARSGTYLLLRAIPFRGLDDRLSGVVINLIDISEIERARESLAVSEERFRQIADNITEVLWSRSADGQRLEYVGAAYERIWQRPAGILLEEPSQWFAAIHDEDRKRVSERYEALDGDEFEIDYRIVHENGDVRWIKDRGFPIRDQNGEVLRYAGIAEDVTSTKKNEAALREAARDLESLALRDPLTGLSNRRGFERTLSRETARARRTGTRLIALLVDCDDFKAVNDTHGHAVGDLVLQEISRRLEMALRPTDCVARIGGDEFLSLLPDTRLGDAYRVAERVRATVADCPIDSSNGNVRVTVSIGVTEIGSEVVTTQDVVSLLHEALRRGKTQGKNRVAASKGMEGVEGVEAEAEVLRRVRSGAGFRVFAQSIRRLEDGVPIGRELLSRGPVEGPENPTDLFRLSMDHDLLMSTDIRCLENCLAVARSLKSPKSEVIHLNLYPSTLLALDPERIDEYFPPRVDGDVTLCVELSEQQVIGQPVDLRRRVSTLQERGVQVALDDVGYGRSSLEALIVLEPDVIKIDRGFVRGCARDSSKRHWVERLTSTAGALSARVIAEGVETRADLDVLRDIGIDSGQGFLWDRPQQVEN